MNEQNDLGMGSQGYSSCNESMASGQTYGVDTYHAHLPSQHDNTIDHYGAAQSVYSHNELKTPPIRKAASRAYGMQHGNWMGMETSFKDNTLGDMTKNSLGEGMEEFNDVVGNLPTNNFGDRGQHTRSDRY